MVVEAATVEREEEAEEEDDDYIYPREGLVKCDCDQASSPTLCGAIGKLTNLPKSTV